MPENADDDLESTLPDPDGDVPLAVVVEKAHTETAIESLRSEGVYDDSRRVRAVSEATPLETQTAQNQGDVTDRIALPVTEPPTETRVLEVIRQVDPDYRSRDLEDLLVDRGWSDADLESAPGSWAVIGSVILVRLPADCPDETEVAEALLDLHGEADSVLADEGIENDGTSGTYREPRTRLLAGDPDTETIHTEHGTRYGLDPAAVMFSPGNQAERARMGAVVNEGERVFDMFAGIGYFTLPMARAGASVTATELNPTAFRYLLENAVLNDVSDRVDAYMTDCRALTGDLEVDRIVMGYYGSSNSAGGDAGSVESDDEEAAAADHGTRTNEANEFLPDALEALSPGGIVHYHEATPESCGWDRPLERLEAATAAVDRELTVLEKRRVKSHSAGVSHVVVDARFD
ncbi:class I SAM-dependent methyltransferase [Natrarchaeobaculum sulfurireducens]|uniref:tRNA(Phe) (4-demethylwyosine(37)-C(7)) aminocarboxypropyltransferase n=1 Tax=Natrarchaeobaculum sulfurireducens TaxID=2044521 RepID=A0A346PKT7_9EURY|nr:class I SAM-dependent methyltransferase family protein [Natrarchaeobaculum sulfurireducens]AXR80132.1 tRNA methylase Trm12p Wyeosine biosynthesis [Natrarchaeobaculum sulfurireducens]